MNSIARRLALSFVGFVSIGSLVLVWGLSMEERRQSREVFSAMARTNADFLNRQNLALTDRTANGLSEVLGVRVAFALTGKAPDIEEAQDVRDILAQLPLTAPGQVKRLPGPVHSETVAQPVSDTTSIFLFRTEPSRFGFLSRPRSLISLGVFWLLSLGLGWLVSRGIVRPLRTVAARLPRISDETIEPLPEANRGDEIGQVARVFNETRSQLTAERAARQAAERQATLGRMATGMAHEINNPIAAIKLHAQLLEAEIQGAHPQRLEIILAESARIESLVSQWMFLARPQPPQIARCSLTGLVAEVIRIAEPAATYAKVRLVDELPPEVIVPADRRRLHQAIANIVTNAIHAMAADGGTLTITSEVVMPSHVDLVFSDTGPGFSAQALARATELFFSEKEGGMGIGLNVTAEIVRAHGGELLLANSEKGSARVVIRLPIAVN